MNAYGLNSILDNKLLGIMDWVINEYKRIDGFEKINNVDNLTDEDVLNLLNDIDDMFGNMYANLELKKSIHYSVENLEEGAISLVKPLSKDSHILLKGNKYENADYLSHEIGHIFEKLYLSQIEFDYSVIIDKVTGEVYSSFAELMYIQVLSDKFKDSWNFLYKDYLKQTINLFFKLLNELSQISEDIRQQQFFRDVKKNYCGKIGKKMVKNIYNYNTVYDLFSIIKYFIGKIISLMYLKNNQLNFNTFFNLIKSNRLIDFDNFMLNDL